MSKLRVSVSVTAILGFFALAVQLALSSCSLQTPQSDETSVTELRIQLDETLAKELRIQVDKTSGNGLVCFSPIRPLEGRY